MLVYNRQIAQKNQVAFSANLNIPRQVFKEIALQIDLFANRYSGNIPAAIPHYPNEFIFGDIYKLTVYLQGVKEVVAGLRKGFAEHVSQDSWTLSRLFIPDPKFKPPRKRDFQSLVMNIQNQNTRQSRLLEMRVPAITTTIPTKDPMQRFFAGFLDSDRRVRIIAPEDQGIKAANAFLNKGFTPTHNKEHIII